jgi:CRISPR-associated protein Cmr6
MTPHHPDYYTNENHPVPTDYDSPVPVGFLSVHGKFCFAVGTYDTSDSGKAWRQLSLDLLRFALIERGVDGKTSSGYGRFSALEVATASAASTILHPRSKKAPLYKVGNRVTATRIPDPKGKGRIWFRADDEFSGIVTAGASPSVEIGQTVELEIASIMAAQGYNFRLPRVSPPSAKSHSDKRTTHR